MKKILVNLVHPNIDNSIVNKNLIEEISKLENVTINNLYEEYPDFKINVQKEQELLLKNDIIIFQFPMYWFSSPSLLKEWFDKILEPGFAHGGAYELKDKSFCIAVSCGGAKEAFSEFGKDKKTVEEFLFPLYGTANYIKMIYKKPFISYETESKLSNETLNQYKANYMKYIKELSI